MPYNENIEYEKLKLKNPKSRQKSSGYMFYLSVKFGFNLLDGFREKKKKVFHGQMVHEDDSGRPRDGSSSAYIVKQS